MGESMFELQKWSTSGNALLERARLELSKALSEKIRNLSDRVPPSIIPSDEAVEVVFAGQYSAGKSTILKALTGRRDIETGAAITTQKAHTYDWGGIRVTDTPGIHTGIRPDHDEISYRAISNADLIIFVITNELFDSHLAQHFHKLAIEKSKCHEMMLVVNKMRRSVKGNHPETQKIIREDLQKVLSPFSPEDLRTSFIDAESAIESSREVDPKISKILYRNSGMDSFICKLNDFVRDKGLAGQYTTALYTLEQVLQEALSAEPSGDKDVDALEELLLQQRRTLLETQYRMNRAVESEIQDAGERIRQEGRNVEDGIHASADQKEINKELQAAQNRVQDYSEQLNKTIEEVIGKYVKDLSERISAIADSELAKKLIPRLALRIKEVNISPETMSKLKKTGDVSHRFGQFLIEKSFTLKEGARSLFNLKHYSGTATHGTVKAIGKFFGHKFKPWGAVKWGKGVANFGRGLGVAGIILTAAFQAKEDADAKKREKDLRESRSRVRAVFNEAAHQIEMHFDHARDAFVSKTLKPEVDSFDKQLAELREMQQSRSKLFQNLVSLLDETRRMIKELHTSGEKIA